MSNWIKPASSLPFGASLGGLPNMSGTLLGWLQPILFGVVTKEIMNYQLVETITPVGFQGVVQPFTDRQLMLKPEGQRAWSWYWVHSLTSLPLNVDDIVKYKDKQFRVMSLKDYGDYGYFDYHIVEDYTGAGPEVVTP